MTRRAPSLTGRLSLALALRLTLWLALCTSPAAMTMAASSDRTEPSTDRPGPALTASDRKAFMQPVKNMPFEQRMDFVLGRAIFEKLWVSSPSSTTASDGLGPLYNARSCLQCHINNGRGLPPDEQGSANRNGLLIRLGQSAQTPLSPEQQAIVAQNGRLPDPVYGGQLQTFAVPGLEREADLRVEYRYRPFIYPDGTRTELRQPMFHVEHPRYGALAPDTRISPRIAPAMAGLGLLEQIPAEAILAQEDPDDRDGDGISGRANHVFDRTSGKTLLGRFGWKAEEPSLRLQNANALNTDIGISNPDYPLASGDCTDQQADCLNAPHGNTKAQGGHEASPDIMRVLLFYTRHLAQPSQRAPPGADNRPGADLFQRTGCNRCHTPEWVTLDNPELPALSNKRIAPYTDMLLHDMGEGLADAMPAFSALGHEWRTAPLWGLGQHADVTGELALLHDGRARTIEEAILWHGGEARQARDAFAALAAEQRNHIIRFLESL